MTKTFALKGIRGRLLLLLLIVIVPESLQDLGPKVMEINNEVRRIMADLRPSSIRGAIINDQSLRKI